MRSFRLLLVVLGLLIAVNAMAADQKADSVAARELKPQTNCPVMGGAIDSSAYTDIQGQRVYFCCPGCSAKMKADPDKYFEEASAQGVLFENIQKTCPVTGDSLENKDIHTDYKGRRIYFCCEDCIKKFAENPKKYLLAMDAPAKDRPKMKDKMSDMQHGSK